MTLRPVAQIKVKALGLCWRKDRLLACEIPDTDGRIKGVRPLGGTVEVGETSDQTLRREFQEELGVAIQITGKSLVLENIFEHRGMPGHEIVFLYPITLPDGAYTDQDVIHYVEDNGEACLARWFVLSDLDGPGDVALFPIGLKASLIANAAVPR